MKALFLSIILLFVLEIKSNCQTSYTIPKGYDVYKNYDNKPFILEHDFDVDGAAGKVVVCSKNNVEDENIVVIYLSSKNNNAYYSFPFSSNSYNIETKNNVLIIGSCFGNGRYCKTLKFKFYPALQNMRLIGYDEESFGNAAHEGAYMKSVNLLTNKYEITGPKWKNPLLKTTTFPIMTLDKFEGKSLEYLENIGANYLQ